MNQYKYETHVHTSETSPCARIDGSMVARLYKNAGYQGIVITDHYSPEYFESMRGSSWEEKVDNYLMGYRNAYKEGQRIGLNVLLGMEILFQENYNDYLVYGFDEEFLYNNPRLYTYTLRSFKEFIADKGILLYQAHPFRSWVEPADPEYLDGVEVFNGSPRFNSKNHRAYSFAKVNNLKMISGSDFHERGDLATGGISLPYVPKDVKEFVKILAEDKIVELLSGEE